ncbi:MAG: hypothetical protein HY681_02745, partial [Chloroflexi bacterium]|nr:hypothetical protein [Chloroflexota bacterium]
MPAPTPFNKVMPLPEAVRRFVRPGMTLHVETGPRAAINEIARQFWDKEPGFTLVMLRLGGGHAGHLVLGGLVKKIIGSSYVDNYPTPAPMRVVQAAYKERKIELETWSLLSLIQRFIAGAQGLPFMPTKSLLSTSFEEENKHAFQVVDDVFRTGERVGVVRALNPDLSLVHGVAADPEGNVISFPPSEESFWGAKASRGVVVTVEKVISTEKVREYAHLVKLAPHNVVAVCPAPFGAHPGRLVSRRFPLVPGYYEDEEFQREHRRASRDPKAYLEWVHKWVLDIPDHKVYLKQLGTERLTALRARAKEKPVTFEEVFSNVPDGPPGPYTETELMVVVAARMMIERATAENYTFILAGAGPSDIASSLAYYTLRQQGRDIRLILGTGMYNYIP